MVGEGNGSTPVSMKHLRGLFPAILHVDFCARAGRAACVVDCGGSLLIFALFLPLQLQGGQSSAPLDMTGVSDANDTGNEHGSMLLVQC